MPRVIKRGTPYRYYDFECPKCHSIVRFGESELHEYEDCYDIPMVETDDRCPNCLGSYIQVPKSELKNYLVGAKKNNTEYTEEKKVSFWKRLFKRG